MKHSKRNPFVGRISRFSAKHRWWIVASWLVILIACVFGAKTLEKPMSSSFTIKNLQSITTLNTINKKFGNSSDGGNIVFAAPKGEKLTAEDAEKVAELTQNLEQIKGITSATNPFTAQVKTLSPAGRIGYIAVTFNKQATSGTSVQHSATQNAIKKAVDKVNSPELKVKMTSGLLPASSSSSNPLIGLILAFIILFITFGALWTAGFPLISSVLALGISMTGISMVTHFTTINDVAPVLAMLIGLAVGIDYSLFIINRHKQQLLSGMEIEASIIKAGATAGTAVVFAAFTVIVALVALAVARVQFLTQMGLSAAFAVFVAMFVAITLTPALLAIRGNKILRKRERLALKAGEVQKHGHHADSWAKIITAHPILAILVSVIALLILAFPVLSIHLGLPNDGNQPSDTQPRQAYDLMGQGFGSGVNGPIILLANYPSIQAHQINSKSDKLLKSSKQSLTSQKSSHQD
ncbi:MMPL family transporter [Lactococcus nasutitermitis]|uniref:MMPL family transporter n=1 Tax=Lactococcus nasutitermitis TaxID=1652957 RepID=A0ABV9JE72_9LACT|nr:MMPL family transporter [Lactococcus nasutitermitis]